MKPYRFHPDAKSEFLAAVEYYAGVSPELADRYYQEVNALITEICLQPTVRRMFDPPARRHFGGTFPYAVIYLDQPEQIWIVAVMHFKQRPGYWRERLS